MRFLENTVGLMVKELCNRGRGLSAAKLEETASHSSITNFLTDGEVP